MRDTELADAPGERRRSSAVFVRVAGVGECAAPAASGTFATTPATQAPSSARSSRVSPAGPVPKALVTYGLSEAQRDELSHWLPDVWHLACGAPTPAELRGAVVCAVTTPSGEWEQTARRMRKLRHRWPTNPLGLWATDVPPGYQPMLRETNAFVLEGAEDAIDLMRAGLTRAVTAEAAVVERAKHYSLTQRETQIIVLYMLGVRRARIAGRLGLAEQTVANTINLMLGKIDAPSVAEAVQRYFR